MENTHDQPDRNQDVAGYKIPGDGNAPNAIPPPGNRSFEENPHAVIHKNPNDIPGAEFNIGDKAYFDSTKTDFIKTVSSHHHAEPEIDQNAYLKEHKPDGDR